MPPTAHIAIPEAVPVAPRPRGQDGALFLRAERIAGRTRLTEVTQRPPLATVRGLYLDPVVPDMCFSTIASSAGGVLQGDRLHIDVSVGEHARLHLGTQSATRIYRMPDAGATIDSAFRVAADGYLEYLPDPYLPYASSRLKTRTRCDVDPGGALIVSETVAAGRVASGESLAFERIESRMEIAVGGEVVARDALRLDPADGLTRVGRLGPWRVVGSLFVVRAGFDAVLLQAVIEPDRPGTIAGASTLPSAAGAWLRVLADEPAGAAAVIRAAWTAARVAILGAPPPLDRRP